MLSCWHWCCSCHEILLCQHETWTSFVYIVTICDLNVLLTSTSWSLVVSTMHGSWTSSEVSEEINFHYFYVMLCHDLWSIVSCCKLHELLHAWHITVHVNCSLCVRMIPTYYCLYLHAHYISSFLNNITGNGSTLPKNSYFRLRRLHDAELFKECLPVVVVNGGGEMMNRYVMIFGALIMWNQKENLKSWCIMCMHNSETRCK